MSIYRLRTEMGHYFKWLLLIVVVPVFIIGGATFFTGQTGAGRGGGRPGESNVIAVVNGSEIKRSDFESLWEQTVEQARRAGMRSPLQLADMRLQIFGDLVSSHILIEEAKRLGVDVSDNAVNRELDNYVTMFLKQNRQAVLGKLSAKREATDPRDDREYIDELERSGMSLKQQIEMAESQFPKERVRAGLAQQGISRILALRTKPVTLDDIKASYKVYHIRQLILAPNLPQEQLQTRAAKIRAEALAGTDFAKLVRDNSADRSGARIGGKAEYSFETRYAFPPEVRQAIEKLKPGEISRPIKTELGIYLVKLESVEDKLPEKLDQKARDARRAEIRQDREMMVQMQFQRELRKRQKIKILDPEFNAYWHLVQLERTPPSQPEHAKLVKLALKSLRKASEIRPNNYVQIHLAKLLHQNGQTAEAVRILYPMLEGKDASIEGADLRMLLAEMLQKTGQKEDKERAIQQLMTASEVAPHDLMVHTRLVDEFKRLNRPDLAAKEQQWIADYQKRVAEIEAYRKKQLPSQSPTGPAGR